MMQQVHGAEIAELKRTGDLSGGVIPGCDGVIINGISAPFAAVVKVADCVPVFAFSSGKLLGAFHAGWRSIAAGITEKYIKILKKYGCRDIELFAGPHICGSCFEVGPEVLNKFPDAAAGGSRVDLIKALGHKIEKVGLSSSRLKLFKEKGFCTLENDCYFSYRSGDEKRMAAFAIQH